MTIDAIEKVRPLARAAALEHPDDIDKATDCLRDKVTTAKLQKSIADTLLERAYRDMIHSARHEHNVKLRRENGGYGGPAKVSGAGAALTEVATVSLLATYSIGGRSLGSIRGEEIADMIESENAKADGAMFNATLLSKLRPKVKKDKTIGQCVNEEFVSKLFRELRRKAA